MRRDRRLCPRARSAAPETVGRRNISRATFSFLRRPDKLSALAKDAGKIAGELKDVPKEFKEGLVESGVELNSSRTLDAKKDKVDDAVDTKKTE